jgi:predicted Zn-dependent protease
MNAAVAEFAAATEQGVVVGQVAFIAHGGNTYSVLGYAPESRWSSYSRAVGSSIGSFQRLTDRQALNVQPRRLDIVTLSQSMPFSTFVQRYPSTDRPEIVALINHTSTGATLPAGGASGPMSQ